MLAVKVARGAPVPFCHEGGWLWAPSDGYHSRCCWKQLTAPSAHPTCHVHRGGGQGADSHTNLQAARMTSSPASHGGLEVQGGGQNCLGSHYACHPKSSRGGDWSVVPTSWCFALGVPGRLLACEPYSALPFRWPWAGS